MSSRPGPWARFVASCAERERGTSLALLRIAVALVVVYGLVSIASAGLVPMMWYDRSLGGYRSLPEAQHWLVRLVGGTSPTVVWSLWIAALLAAIVLALGFRARATAFVALTTYFALVRTNPEVMGGYDSMITNALWLLVLADASATLSLDCRIRDGRWTSDRPVLAWPRRVFVVQLLVVYTTTGLHKMSADWTPGGDFSALYWILQDPTWHRFDMRWAAWVFPLTQVATAVTWIWEVTAILMLVVLYFRRTADRPGRVRRLCNRRDLRVPFAITGLALHVGILVLIDVGPFPWISLAYYIALWRPDELHAALAAAWRRVPRLT